MFNILIGIVIILLGAFNIFVGAHKMGFDEREKIFQDTPVTYVAGGMELLRVQNSGGKVKVFTLPEDRKILEVSELGRSYYGLRDEPKE